MFQSSKVSVLVRTLACAALGIGLAGFMTGCSGASATAPRFADQATLSAKSTSYATDAKGQSEPRRDPFASKEGRTVRSDSRMLFGTPFVAKRAQR